MVRSIETELLWLKRIVIGTVSIVAGFFLYDLLIDAFFNSRFQLLPFLAFWGLTSYIVLPRIHRALTKLYVPDYFIGRVRTADGLLADPVNIAFNGSKKQLIKAFTDAGWVIADPITLKSTWRIASGTVLKRSYPSAPVSPLYLFGKQQAIAFQMEVNGNPHARHHVRFWPSPDEWWLPGGRAVDWVGAATYDRSVGLSLLTGQITHKIDENTDEERDFVWQSLSPMQVTTEQLQHFMTAYHCRAGGGDRIKTDGTMVIMSAKSSTK